MSQFIGCGTSDHYVQWVVTARHRTDRGRPSKGSSLRCLVTGCGKGWRTQAKYVDQIPDATAGPDGELRRP